jgi:Protein of unknown function (DUF3306)
MADKPNGVDSSDGFLSRWSRRKQDVRAGVPVGEAPLQAAEPIKTPIAVPPIENYQSNEPLAQQNVAQAATNNVANDAASSTEPAPAASPPAAPTLGEAEALTLESDFKPFMASNVPSEVKNAAMKKLFTDPHYNVMDMMDTYVDDYSKSDPIPESMLKEMVSVKFLKLFERDEEEPEKVKTQVQSLAVMQPTEPAEAIEVSVPEIPPQPRDDADTPGAQSVAQLASSASPENTLPHDDPDLRLQPNDAPERQGLGRSAG